MKPHPLSLLALAALLLCVALVLSGCAALGQALSGTPGYTMNCGLVPGSGDWTVRPGLSYAGMALYPQNPLAH